MKDRVNISLELLVLNDLLRLKIIDKEIYDKAVLQIQNTKLQVA